GLCQNLMQSAWLDILHQVLSHHPDGEDTLSMPLQVGLAFEQCLKKGGVIVNKMICQDQFQLMYNQFYERYAVGSRCNTGDREALTQSLTFVTPREQSKEGSTLTPSASTGNMLQSEMSPACARVPRERARITNVNGRRRSSQGNLYRKSGEGSNNVSPNPSPRPNSNSTPNSRVNSPGRVGL
ncbi:MAG: hypothetical protein KDH94_08885, partial [Coxiellaceae bacterium]|nr:hypothetical protein [Coxiellaceae bacterium]